MDIYGHQETIPRAGVVGLKAFTGYAFLLAILFSVLCLPGTVVAQTQLGSDIDGELSKDYSGTSVSLSSDGKRLAIGADGNDGNGDLSGHVRVYRWSGTAWSQLGANIDGEAAGDRSGHSVSLSSDGNRVAIGAPKNTGTGSKSGHVRVYQWSGVGWTQLGADIDGEAANDDSGEVSLSSDGNRVAIGGRRNVGSGNGAGHVRVYQWSGTAWSQLGADIDGEAAEDQFGRRVSLSSDGNRLAIGAPLNNSNGSWSGHVRVYQWSGTVWSQLGTDIDGEAAGAWFGESVSLSLNGNRLAVGVPYLGTSGIDPNRAGQVRVYQWSGTAWVQLGADIDGEAAGDWSGDTVSLSSDGNRLAIGAEKNGSNVLVINARVNNSGGVDAGHVRVYQWSGTVWEQHGADIDGEAAGDRSGEAVSLSSDGNRLAIGAYPNDGNGESSGHVRVYDLSMFNVFRINAGLNDAWYYSLTDGQGFFITVFPELGFVSLAWFTYDTSLPPIDAIANLGDAGHRWITALGPIDGDHAVMDIDMTSGGIFDTATEIQHTDPPGSDGTIILTFHDCNSATVEYNIPSINQQGSIPITRVADDNIVICEALATE